MVTIQAHEGIGLGPQAEAPLMSAGKLDQPGMHKAAVSQQENPLPQRQDQHSQLQQPFVALVPAPHTLTSEHALDQ